ncbi:MAG: hypothetical protein AAF703_17800 [Cyanobacteria bacterium P01_D01_bin.105]
MTWLLFGIANVGLYVFTEKYFALQSLIGLLGTAMMDFVIVGMIVFLKAKKKALDDEFSCSAYVGTNRDSQSDLGALSRVEQSQ